MSLYDYLWNMAFEQAREGEALYTHRFPNRPLPYSRPSSFYGLSDLRRCIRLLQSAVNA